ncbi:hypothetical protein AB0424_28675 [Streptomyces sp. NPDC051180]|uniref:hypothetical protein n=1 Tax=unclassified Streptomyces TaxID=2593676 RepID=UPI00344CA601
MNHMTGTISTVNAPACLTCYAETSQIGACRAETLDARRDAAHALYAALLDEAAEYCTSALDDIAHDLIAVQEPRDGLAALESHPVYSQMRTLSATAQALRLLAPATFPSA